MREIVVVCLNKGLQKIEVGGHIKFLIVATQVLDNFIKIDLNMLRKQNFMHLSLQSVHSLQGHYFPCLRLIKLSEQKGQDLLKEGILVLFSTS